MSSIAKEFKEYLKDIKFSHSIFAFPFAISAFFLERLPIPTVQQVLLLIVCMISARSFAMGVNRLFDWKLDRENPRTVDRSIPAGKLKVGNAWMFTLGFALVFVVSTFYLSEVAFYASVPVLIFLGGYSLMKRIHFLTHLYLGLCLGLAPNAVYVALTGSLSRPMVFLGLAIAVWTAGFDILYSLQDMKHDKKVGLNSVPSFFGTRGAVYISRGLFLAMILLLVMVGINLNLGLFYFTGVVIVSLALAYEHWLVRGILSEGQTVNIGKAFFDINAWVSIGFLLFVILERSL
jgi:4-hydroxybenzoate polyprenyltransferase